jgi:outer membrane protein assembly factor BamB
LLNGHVYAAFGGLFGDCGTYTGSVASVDAASGQVAWYSASTSGRGGIWAPGGAPVAGNRLYFSVGNGNAGGSAAWDGTDSVVALASDSPGPQPKRADIFAPSRWAADNAADADLGSMNPALVDGHVLIAGKAGLGYVLDANHLGGVTAQPTAFDHCHGFGAAAVDGDVAYVPCAGGIAAVRVGSDGSASVRWRATVAAVGSPSIGGGCIWSADWSNGILYALDPATGKTAGQVKTGALPHFASPSISGSRLVLGTLDGIEIFSF